MSLLDYHRSTHGRQTMLGDQVLLVEDPDRALVQRFANRDASAGMGMRRRVTAAAIAHQAVLRNLPVADITGVVRRLAVQRRQSLVRKAYRRDLPRGRMHPAVGFFAPGQRLPVQIL